MAPFKGRDILILICSLNVTNHFLCFIACTLLDKNFHLR